MPGPSPRDIAEVRSGRGSARDRAEVGKYRGKSRKAMGKKKRKKK